MKYLAKLPAPGEIPPGQVVVHNDVLPAKRLGVRGFRAWLDAPTDHYVVCDCDWAPELGEHYLSRWRQIGRA